MRVLHVYSGNLYGGIEAILVALHAEQHRAAGAAAVRHEFALFFDGRLADALAGAGATIHRLGAVRVSRPHTVHRARTALRALLASGSFDRVVCHAPWAQGLFGGTIRRAGAPLVFWAHDLMRGQHWTERLARRHRPDLMICNSHYTASTRRALYPDAPAVVLYAPVRPAPALAAQDRAAVRTSLQTAPDAVVVVQASRLEAWKGLTILVDALAAMRAVPGWVFWQIGGPQRPVERALLDTTQRIAEQSGIADRVRWIGERSDVPRLLAAADIYCQPNLAPEPFGVVFVEALAAGLPVVTSRHGGACEVIDERSGILVAPGSSAEVAAALRALIVDEPLRRELGAASPRRARLLCDPAAQYARLTDALTTMAHAEVA